MNLARDTKLPSYSTFRRVMPQLDFQAGATAVNDGAQTYSQLEPGEWLAMDGQSLLMSCHQLQPSRAELGQSSVAVFRSTGRSTSSDANGEQSPKRTRSSTSVIGSSGT